MTTLHRCRNLVALGAWVAIFAVSPDCRAAAPRAGGPAGGAGQDLANRLTSNNQDEREAAQRQAAVFFDLLGNAEALRKLADAASDEDVRDFLKGRVTALKNREEGRRQANLPGISLNMKDASLQEVIDTLNKSVNSGLSYDTVTDPGFGDRFNLSVTDKPFWEIFAALHQQHALAVSGTSGAMPGLRLATSRTPPAGLAIDGPAIGFVNSINMQRSTAGEAEGRKATLNLQCMVAFDPRLNLSRYQTPVIAKAVDDRGQAYPSTSQPMGDAYIPGTTMPAQVRSYTLTAPAELGKKLSFALDTTVDMNVVSGVVTIADMEHNVNKLVVLGNRNYRISRWEVAPQPTAARTGAPAATAPARYNITIVPGDASSAAPATAPAAAPGNNSSIQYLVTDAAGKPIWRGNSNGANVGVMNTTLTGTTGPYKLEIKSFSGTLPLPVHLQFKDVALP